MLILTTVYIILEQVQNIYLCLSNTTLGRVILPIHLHIKPTQRKINLTNPTEEKYPMKNLRSIFSTAAVLAPSTFEYVYEAFGPNIQLASITGGIHNPNFYLQNSNYPELTHFCRNRHHLSFRRPINPLPSLQRRNSMPRTRDESRSMGHFRQIRRRHRRSRGSGLHQSISLYVYISNLPSLNDF